MNLHKYIKSFTITFLLFTFFSVSCQKKTDISEVIVDDNPKEISNYLNGLHYSEADYGSYKSGTYFPINNNTLNLQIFKIPIRDISISFFDSKIGQIIVKFKKEENFENLKEKLHEKFGEPIIEKEDNIVVFKWTGKDNFYYKLTKETDSYIRESGQEKEEVDYELTIIGEVVRKINKDREQRYLKSTTIDKIIVENNPQLIFNHLEKFNKEKLIKGDKIFDIYLYKYGTKQNSFLSFFSIPVESIKLIVYEDEIIFIEIDLEVNDANIKHIEEEFTKYLGMFNQEVSIIKGSKKELYYNNDKTGYFLDTTTETDINEGSLDVGYTTKTYIELDKSFRDN